MRNARCTTRSASVSVMRAHTEGTQLTLHSIKACHNAHHISKDRGLPYVSRGVSTPPASMTSMTIFLSFLVSTKWKHGAFLHNAGTAIVSMVGLNKTADRLYHHGASTRENNLVL